MSATVSPLAVDEALHIRTADDRTAKALHGRLEGKAGARAGFVKERCHDVPIRHFVAPEFVRSIRQIEDLLDLVIGQIGNRYQVPRRT